MYPKLLVLLVLLPLAALPACRTDPNRSPSTTIVGGTAGGAAAGALLGWAAGKPGTGAAVGAGVGLLAGAIQADADARERERIERRRDTTYVVRERPRETYRSERDVRRDLAYDYLHQAQRTGDPAQAESLLKRSLTEYRTPEAHTALGELYEAQKDWSGAESEFRRALDLDEDYRPARDALDRIRGR